VEIHFHAHHADVSDAMRKRAEREVRRVAVRLPRVVEAIVRFELDGTVRRVSVALRAPQHHDLIGRAEGRFYGPALVQALQRVKAQAAKEKKGLPKGRAHRDARRSAN
jgi:ribosome-associated translation inhibitor RaiA